MTNNEDMGKGKTIDLPLSTAPTPYGGYGGVGMVGDTTDIPDLTQLSLEGKMSNSDSMALSDLMCEIAAKGRWYEKIQYEHIVQKWRDETGDPEYFDTAIGILRATAQGCNIKPCGWSSDHSKGRCECVPPDCDLTDYIEYTCDDYRPRLKKIIKRMMEQEPIDWHPGSNNQVRDLIHPSMYCYVKGKSVHNDGSVEGEVDEKMRYQWLPTEFVEHDDDEVKIDSYINNLDHERYPEFVEEVEGLLNDTLTDIQDVTLTTADDGRYQVIVKVASIHLDRENPEYLGGSWHIEGVPYEHIVGTCIHYVECTGTTESFLEFRKPTFIDEENLDYPQSDSDYTTHHYGIAPDSHFDGRMNRYLGLIKCTEGATVIFPNTLQHRVKGFRLKDGAETGTRVILAMFVIDPSHRITSTKDIPPQQKIFTPEEARHYRERLMYFRKYYVDVMNEAVYERPFSLCEH